MFEVDDPFYAIFYGFAYVAPMCSTCDGPIYPDPVGDQCAHCASRTVEQDTADALEVELLLREAGLSYDDIRFQRTKS